MVDNDLDAVNKIIEPYKKYNYPMFIVTDEGEPEQIGTFVIIKLKSSFYLLTAAHVANICSEKGYYYFFDNSYVEFTGSLLKTEGSPSDVTDIAILKLNDEFQTSGFNIVTEELLPRPGQASDGIHSFIGYPASKTKLNRPEKKIRSNLHVFYNTLCASDIYKHNDLNIQDHIAIVFDKKNCLSSKGEKVTFPDPQGMSGGGIWCHEVISGKTLLVGIASTWKRKNKCLFGSRLTLIMGVIQMSVEDEINKAFSEAAENYDFIANLIDLNPPESDSDYININRAYFRMCTNFNQSLMMLIGDGKPYPAIVILRSMLEIFTKALYIEYVEKSKGTDILPMISGEKSFPNFANMSKELDKFLSGHSNGPDNFFKQFTKRGLGQYEKFSLFTHGRGDYILALMKSTYAPLHLDDVRDLILTAKGMYEVFALFYFGVQGEKNKFRLVGEKLMKSSQHNLDKDNRE